MARAYLDHASTTPPRPEAARRTRAAGPRCRPATPAGCTRRAASSATRSRRPRAGGGPRSAPSPRQVVFTSGATEAINAAVWGATPRRAGRARAVRRRRALGRPRRLGPPGPDRGHRRSTATGRLDVEALRDRLQAPALPRPALVHCQWANHEVGTLQPVHEVVALCRDAGVTVHVDAAAACGHVPTDLGALGRRPGQRQRAQARRRARCRARWSSGGAAGSSRCSSAASRSAAAGPGSRPIPALLAFGAAAAALAATAAAPSHEEADDGAAADRAVVHGGARGRRGRGRRRRRAEDRLPHLVCLGVHGVEAEPVLIGLDRAGVAVHSGSACSSESIEPSPVLEAMGVDPSHSLRVSVGWTTTDEDCAAFADAFAARRRRPAGATGLTARSSWSSWSSTSAAPGRGTPTPCRHRSTSGRRPAAARRPGGSSARKSLNCATAAAWLWSWFSRIKPRVEVALRSRSGESRDRRLDLGRARSSASAVTSRCVPMFHCEPAGVGQRVGLDGSSESTLS